MIHWVSYLLSQEHTGPTPGRPGSREYIYAQERMLERLASDVGVEPRQLRDRLRTPRARQRRRPIRRLAAQGLRRLSALLTSTAEWLTRSETVEGGG